MLKFRLRTSAMEMARPTSRIGKMVPINCSPLVCASVMELTRLLITKTNAAGSRFRSRAVITTPDVSPELVAQVSLKAQVMVERLVLKLFKVIAGPKKSWWVDFLVLNCRADYPDIQSQLPQ